MLAEQRRHPDGRGRAGELDGIAHRDVAAPHRMGHLDDHVTGVEMRIGEHLAGVEAGSTGYARGCQDLHDLVLRALAREALHETIDFHPALPARGRRLVAWISDEVGAPHGAEEGMPHLLLHVDEDVIVWPA